MNSNIFRSVLKSLNHKISHIRKVIYYQPLMNRLSKRGSRRIILIGTPEHGNLGDHLIAQGELTFLSERFADDEVIEITGAHYRLLKKRIARNIRDTDIIAITGGGFLGSLWMIEEEMVRDIIRNFKRNRIVIFPSTIYFEDNAIGRKELETSKMIYRQHKDLTVCVRDEASSVRAFELLKNCSTHNIVYAPDMALYLDKSSGESSREGVLFCFRQDKEKVLSEADIESVRHKVENYGVATSMTSTVINRSVLREDREKELEVLISRFKKAQLVITDRLHAMILSAITSTPCIAMDNASGKVKGVYDWIRDLNYIAFIDQPDQIEEYLQKYLTLPDQLYSKQRLSTAFKKIEQIIRNEE